MKRDVYQHLWNTYGRLPLLWLGIVAEIIRSFLQRIVSVIIVSYISFDIASGNIEGVKRNILLFFVLYTIGAITGVIGELMCVYTTDQRYEVLLRNFYKKIVGKDMSFYRDHQTGYLSTLFRQHLDSSMSLVRILRGDVIKITVSLIAPIIVLFFVGWQFGLVTLLLVLIEGWYIFWASDRTHKYRKPAQEIYRKLTAEVADEVTNAVAFKSGGHEDMSQGKVASLAHQEAELFWARHKANLLFDLPMYIIPGLGSAAFFYLVLTQSSTSPESVALIFLTFTYIFQITRNVGDLPDLVQRIDEHIARVHPTLEYLGDAYETVKDPTEPKSLVITEASLEIKNVDFAYSAKGTKVFEKLNLTVKGGERVGIVGLSGAGKSTLASLLMRFDDVSDGSISIDGIDIRHVRQSELRQKIAYIPQEPLLFHRSIKENIAYFKQDATDAEIEAAAKAAHAHEFISKFEKGYDTMVGERGVKLSGGQKQRIVIARAILKNASVMIFDEATSALDSESEQIIQKSLPEIIGKKTAIVIAHRLSTVAWLDRILVMHNGKIIEEGTHAELLAKEGQYKSFWDKQTSGGVMV